MMFWCMRARSSWQCLQYDSNSPQVTESHQWKQATKSHPSEGPARGQCNPHVLGRCHHVAGQGLGGALASLRGLSMTPCLPRLSAAIRLLFTQCATGSCAHNLGSRQTPVPALETAQDAAHPTGLSCLRIGNPKIWLH